MLDIVFAGAAILILAPLFIVTMLVLKITGEGEVFYQQARIGKNYKKFGLFKFATMLKASESMGTGTITVKNDPRVLPVGKFLRKTKINELPQLLNIMLGDMSIVGPRPQEPRCFNAFPEHSQEVITRVRPGLSGIGSIVFRDEEEIMHIAEDPDAFYDNVVMPYKGKLEEWYVTNQSLRNYLLVIIVTVWVVIKPDSQIIWKLFPDMPKPPPELANLVS